VAREAHPPAPLDRAETLEAFMRQTAEFQENVLCVIGDLLHTQTQLIGIVDSLSSELEHGSAPSAPREADRTDTPTPADVLDARDQARQARQHAVQLTERAALVANRARAS
jgi:hypothetical protein